VVCICAAPCENRAPVSNLATSEEEFVGPGWAGAFVTFLFREGKRLANKVAKFISTDPWVLDSSSVGGECSKCSKGMVFAEMFVGDVDKFFDVGTARPDEAAGRGRDGGRVVLRKERRRRSRKSARWSEW
jgi:hypothetical protein